MSKQHEAHWSNYDVSDLEEIYFLMRIFKKFYFKTIETKYGYLKSNSQDEV